MQIMHITLRGRPATLKAFLEDVEWALTENEQEESSEVLEQASSPGEESSEVLEQASSPGEESSEVLEQASSPGEESSEALVQASSPGEESSEVLEQASSSGEESSEVLVQASSPGEESSDVLVQASSPGGESSEVLVQASSPGGESSKVLMQASSPGEESCEILVQASSPEEESCEILVQASSPGGESSEVLVQASSPGEESSEVLVQASSPGEESSDVLVQASSPGEESSDVLVQASSPGKESSDVLVQASSPGGESSEVLVQASSPGGESSDVLVQASSPGEESSEVLVQASSSGEESSEVLMQTSSPGDEQEEESIPKSMTTTYLLEFVPEALLVSSTGTEEENSMGEVVDDFAMSPVIPFMEVVGSSDTEEDFSIEEMASIVKDMNVDSTQLKIKFIPGNVRELSDHEDIQEMSSLQDLSPPGDVEASSFRVNVEDASFSGDEIKDAGILRDRNNQDIYVRKVIKSALVKTNQKKVNDRVYNSQHACLFCGKLIFHIRAHVVSKHKREDEVVAALEDVSGCKMSLLRARGDDAHNAKVIKEGKGCMLISRRPTKNDFNSSEYGPCIHCREWLLKTTLKRHQTKCMARHTSSIPTLSKKNLIMQSDIISGRIQSSASGLLKREVFTIMHRDNISEIAQNDFLIVALGESWLRKNISNKLKRKYYASQRMRLNARLLLNLQENEKDTKDGQTTGKTLWDFLVPDKFDSIADAAIQVAMPMMEDEEDLKSPSNAIKLKYDLDRLINAKWCFALKKFNSKLDEKRKNRIVKDCKGMLKLLKKEWPEKVTKFAHMVLAQRQREVQKHIPSPDDIKLLNEHISGELKVLPMRPEKRDYQRAVRVAQAKLLIYNKRRGGEIDAISLRDYAARSKDLSDVDQSLIGDLTQLERHLLTSQELMTVRGKRDRSVPCIVPYDVLPVLQYISGQEVRDKCGINRSNKFLFASTGDNAVRSYDSLKMMTNELNLKNPERITSVSLRKYTATLSQVINLKPNELQWVCNHLGHTTRVHLEHYRQMSGFIERVKISKILLMQDMNLTEKYVGKSLDSITFEDLVQTQSDEIHVGEQQPPSDDGEIQQPPMDSEEQQAHNDGEQNDATLDQLFLDADEEPVDMMEEFSEEEEEPKPKKKRQTQTQRQRWTKEEEDEIKRYFANYLDSKTTPGVQVCQKRKKQSLKDGGVLHKRASHLIVKKISAMNHK